MKTTTTLAALLLSACTVPGLQAGSTFSAASTSSAPAASAPAASSAPAAAAPAPSSTPAASGPAASVPAGAASPATQADALTARDVEPIDEAARWLDLIAAGTIIPDGGTRESELRDHAMYCSDQTANLIAHDHPRSAVLPLEHGSTRLGEADAKICQVLAKAADGWDARAKQAYAAHKDSLLEPYRKAGVSGDKLKLVDDLGKQLIGPGHAEATPAIVARASVLFSLRDEGERVDGGHDWTIVRYAFSGNHQTRVTEKGYHDRPGPGAYR